MVASTFKSNISSSSNKGEKMQSKKEVDYDARLKNFYEILMHSLPHNWDKVNTVYCLSEALRRACTDPKLNLPIISEDALKIHSDQRCDEHVYGVTWCMGKIYDMFKDGKEIPSFRKFKKFAYNHMITVQTTSEENMLLRKVATDDPSLLGFQRYWVTNGAIRLFDKRKATNKGEMELVEVTQKNIGKYLND
jgi:hypothetical protein